MNSDKKADFKKCEEKANLVLEENCVLEAPIPIKALARQYGLTLAVGEPTKIEISRFSGYLDFEEQEIVVNCFDSVYRQRFTIAHELGHFLMHQDLSGNKKLINRKSPINSKQNDKPWYETEADAFAAHLLVPLHFLKKEDLTISTIQDLSKKYGVSFDVIGYQLKRIER